ncbi:MAG: iron-sulfur cluster assembly protein [Pirellulaceae bacterium]|nr:iron-sulfur cluster assembly protein [Pirellulaceae bacterium]
MTQDDNSPEKSPVPNSETNTPLETQQSMDEQENVDEPVKGHELTEGEVRETLKEVIDPELFVNIVDLGLIYTVNVKPRESGESYDVEIEMTMTSPMCPAGPQLVGNSKQVVSDLPSVVDVDVKVVMDPPWTQDMMSEDAKDQLNIF